MVSRPASLPWSARSDKLCRWVRSWAFSSLPKWPNECRVHWGCDLRPAGLHSFAVALGFTSHCHPIFSLYLREASGSLHRICYKQVSSALSPVGDHFDYTQRFCNRNPKAFRCPGEQAIGIWAQAHLKHLCSLEPTSCYRHQSPQTCLFITL